MAKAKLRKADEITNVFFLLTHNSPFKTLATKTTK